MRNEARRRARPRQRALVLALVLLPALLAFVGLLLRGTLSSSLQDATSPTPGFDPAWSPDGTHIVYCQSAGARPSLLARPNANHLVVWDISGNQYRNLSVERPAGWDIFWPSWRRDSGLYVVAVRHDEPEAQTAEFTVLSRHMFGTRELWYVRPESGSFTRVLGFGTAPTVRWVSRLGKFVANVWPKGGPFSVRFFVLSADGKVESETDVVGEALPICPSDMIDADTVVFAAVGPGEDPDPRTQPSMSLATCSLGTAEVKRLAAPEEGLIYTLAVSTDGTRIAYTREPAPGSASRGCDLLVWGLAEGMAGEVASDACGDASVAWSPDDRYIAYTSAVEGKIRIVAVPKELGKSKR